MGRRGSWFAPAAAAVAAAIVGGVAASGDARGPNGWHRTDVKAVTQPAAVGGRLVVYAVRRGFLEVVALDARTGSTVWSAPATPSEIAPGEPPSLAVIRGDVFYLGRHGGALAEVIARDVATGKIHWKSAVGAFATWPGACPDATTAVCLTGLLSTSAQRGAQLRFDAKTGKQLPGAVISTRFGGRELAPDLFDPGDRNPELIIATSGAHESWRRPLRAIFTLPGASTDWGWNFDRANRPGLFVGSPGWKPVKLTSTRYSSDLSKAMTAGFRISDGTVVWRSSGSFICYYLPCPGDSEAGYSSPSNAHGPGPTVALRVRGVGRVNGSFNGLPVASRSARLTIEGFDPGTGHTMWHYDAGHATGLITQRFLPPRMNSTTIVLPRGRRLVALDLRSGRQRPVAASAAAWCRKPVLYKQRGSRLTTYIGQFSLYPCTAKGRRRTTSAAPPSFVSSIGASSANVVAWTDAHGVVAVRAR